MVPSLTSTRPPTKIHEVIHLNNWRLCRSVGAGHVHDGTGGVAPVRQCPTGCLARARECGWDTYVMAPGATLRLNHSPSWATSSFPRDGSVSAARFKRADTSPSPDTPEVPRDAAQAATQMYEAECLCRILSCIPVNAANVGACVRDVPPTGAAGPRERRAATPSLQRGSFDGEKPFNGAARTIDSGA